VITKRSAKASLAASERAVWFLIERGERPYTVAEIAEAVGINERTFYRYFPTRHDVVRPVLDWGVAKMADAIAEGQFGSIQEAVEESFAATVGGDLEERSRLLFPLILNDPQLKAVLLSVHHDAETALRRAIANRTGREPDDLATYVVAAHIVTAVRLAIELMVSQGSDPIETCRCAVSLIPDDLLEVTSDVSTPQDERSNT
jgi:AcrR family transcriptional regulator